MIHSRCITTHMSTFLRRRLSSKSYIGIRVLHEESCRRPFQLNPCSSFSSNLSANYTTTSTTVGDGPLKSNNISKPMDLSRLYRFLDLETFTEDELRAVFARIQQEIALSPDNERSDSDPNVITHAQITNFLVQRFRQLEQPKQKNVDGITPPTNIPKLDNINVSDDDDEDETTQVMRRQYAAYQATRMFHIFHPNSKDDHSNLASQATISLDSFVTTIRTKATDIDVPGMWPITVSMLLVGSSVGILTPAMPFVVEELGLTPGQYGYVVSAFALAKMTGNIPSAILVERHGRKPYLVYSLSIVALGVAGMGFATEFEHLYVCRLLTGLGVAGLSTAATMSITDLSTPLNRASTMAPIMSAFAAGTALGPALGGYLVDGVGLQSTFFMVGASYLGLTLVNAKLLKETKPQDMIFPWQKRQDKPDGGTKLSILASIQSAVGQWVPLLQDSKIRNFMIMQGFYWVALAGAQMTLLPLLLTDPNGLALTATQVGQVYMGTSMVQVLGNPVFARFTDRVLGKRMGIVTGCTLISAAMAGLPFCTDMISLAAVMATWATGSSFLSTAPVAYISDHVEPHQRAQALALLRTAGDVGFLLGATGIGTLADTTGDLNVAMSSSAGVLFTATAWFATRRHLTLSSAHLTSPSISPSTTTSVANPSSVTSESSASVPHVVARQRDTTSS